MVKKQEIKLFGERKIRTIWDDNEEKWYFSITDVVGVLTDSKDPKRYWSVLKVRLKREGVEPTTICSRLKLPAADGKLRMTDVADQEQLFRLIQSIPSPKAEPFKQWMAQVASNRIDQMQDPELSIDQAMADYKRLGYSDRWIKQRLKSIEVRKDLTDEWQRGGITESKLFAILTNTLTKQWSGKTVKEYKQYKGLKKESLRDNMTNLELTLNTLAEVSATEFSKQQNPKTFNQHSKIAKEGGEVAKTARREIEKRLGRSVVTRDKASDYILPDNGDKDTPTLEEK